MKKLLLPFILLISTALFAQNETSVTTFILVRHAEKGNDGTNDPDLKPEGHERAKRLAALLSNTNIDAVYSTPYNRTKNTVAPVAQAKGLEIQSYNNFKAEFLDGLIKELKGKTILVAGHSNTVPLFANILLGKEAFKDFDDSDYGNILIISITQRGNGSVTRLTY